MSVLLSEPSKLLKCSLYVRSIVDKILYPWSRDNSGLTCFASKVDWYSPAPAIMMNANGVNTKSHPQPVSKPQCAASNPMVSISHDQNQDQASCHEDGVLLLCHPRGRKQ